MKKVLKMMFITIALSMLISCAGNKINFKVENDYIGKSLNSKKLVVRSFLNEIELRDTGKNPYKDKTELDLQNALKENIKLSSTFEDVRLENLDKNSFEKKILDLTNKQMEISVPSSSLNIDDSDFVLFIEDYQLYHVLNPTNNMVATYHEVEFLIWDNQMNSIVSYGVLDFPNSKFDKSVSTLVKLIFDNSPFKVSEVR